MSTALASQGPPPGAPIQPGQALSLRTMTPDQAVVLRSPDREYLVTARDIVAWVAPTAPINEAKKFLVTCQQLGLNPLLGEIYLLPFNGGQKWGAVVAKNGYVRIARKCADYDGHESGIVIQPLNPDGTPRGPMVDIPGAIMPPAIKGKPQALLAGAWAKFYRKGVTRPVYKRVSFIEYTKNQPGPWQSIPCTMIEKVAIAAAGREAFSIGDVYDEAEYPGSISARQPVEHAAPSASLQTAPSSFVASIPSADPDVIDMEDEPEPEPVRLCTPEQVTDIRRLISVVKMTGPDIGKMLDKRNVSRIEDLTAEQSQTIINTLEHIASRFQWNPLGDPTPASPEPETEPEPESTPDSEPATPTEEVK